MKELNREKKQLPDQKDVLSTEQREVFFQLGKLVYELCQTEALQFLFLSEYQEAEKAIHRLLKEADGLENRIFKFTKGKKNLSGECGDGGLLPELPKISEQFIEAERSVQSREVEINPVSSQSEKPVSDKIFKTESDFLTEAQNNPTTFTELRSAITFENNAEKQRFEQCLTLMSSPQEIDREKGFRRIVCSFGKEVIGKVARIAMKDASVNVRRSVLKTLGRTGENGSREILQIALQDPESSIRISAIERLSMFLFADSVPVLKPMLKDQDPAVRSTALLYLGLYGSDLGVSEATRLRNDPSSLVRKNVAKMLGLVKPAQAVTLLKEMLSDHAVEVQETVKTVLSKEFKKCKKM